MINVDVNAKNWFIKVFYDKGFIWNPSKCECEYYKSCDFGEYLDYQNCKYKKKLVNKLVDYCTEILKKQD